MNADRSASNCSRRHKRKARSRTSTFFLDELQCLKAPGARKRTTARGVRTWASSQTPTPLAILIEAPLPSDSGGSDKITAGGMNIEQLSQAKAVFQ